MTASRSSIVCPATTPYYHCITRVVRRAFLLGDDQASAKDFSHRREWVKEELAFLSNIFAVTVCGYSLMDNHMHTLLRIEEQLCAKWSDEEVLKRAKALHPMAYRAAEDEKRLDAHAALYRERLTSLSWFMRELNMSIAKRANKEDRVTGRFWEGRFKSKPLLDEGAVLACLAYIDLNPAHAGLATCLSECGHTSIEQRLRAVGEERAREMNVELEGDDEDKASRPKLALMAGEQVEDEYIARLPISLRDYVAFVLHTGRALRKGKRGALPMELSDTLTHFKLDDKKWLRTVSEMPARYAMLGERHLIDTEAKRRGVRASGTKWGEGADQAE